MIDNVANIINFDGYEINFYNGATDDDIIQFIDLDRIVYPENYQISHKIIQRWNEKNPNLYCVAKDVHKNKVIGYMGFFPLTEDMFIESLQIDFDENHIAPEHVERYERSGIYYLYINSVVVSPDFQKYPVVYGNIFGTFLNSVIELASNDIFFCDACGRATSEEGAKQCRSLLRMKEVASDDTSGLRIFHSKLLPMGMRLPFDAGRKIYNLFSEKYESIGRKSVGLEDVAAVLRSPARRSAASNA